MTASVLLVSKDRERISSLEARLYKEYYTVHIAENSSQTIEHIAKYKIDVIILGIDSPFGGTNLHLPDGKALACHVRHDALAS